VRGYQLIYLDTGDVHPVPVENGTSPQNQPHELQIEKGKLTGLA